MYINLIVRRAYVVLIWSYDEDMYKDMYINLIVRQGYVH